MLVQLALDDITLDGAIALLKRLGGDVDIAEIGTPMIIEYGMGAVRAVRKEFPHLTVTADAKIMDAGSYEATQCFGAGADIVTVMGITHDETIRGAVAAAGAAGGRIMADMMCVPDLTRRALELRELGVHLICVHTAVDVQGVENPFQALAELRTAVPGEYCCIAGGVTAHSVAGIAGLAPGIIIVGGGITKAADPVAAARAIRAAIL